MVNSGFFTAGRDGNSVIFAAGGGAPRTAGPFGVEGRAGTAANDGADGIDDELAQFDRVVGGGGGGGGGAGAGGSAGNAVGGRV